MVQSKRLTALFGVPVISDQGLLGVGAEKTSPVDGVVVAKLAVVRDVDVSCTNLIERLQLQ